MEEEEEISLFKKRTNSIKLLLNTEQEFDSLGRKKKPSNNRSDISPRARFNPTNTWMENWRNNLGRSSQMHARLTNKPRDWRSTPKSIALMTHHVAYIPWSPLDGSRPLTGQWWCQRTPGSDLRLLVPSTSLVFVPRLPTRVPSSKIFIYRAKIYIYIIVLKREKLGSRKRWKAKEE